MRTTLGQVKKGQKFILLRTGEKWMKTGDHKHYASTVKPVNRCTLIRGRCRILPHILNNSCHVELCQQ